MTGFWTDERKQLVKKLWLDGWSASQIAKEVAKGVDRKIDNAPSRNAVIGMLHRTGVSTRSAASKPPEKQRNNPAVRAAIAGTTPFEKVRPQKQPRAKALSAAPPEPGFEPLARDKFVPRARPADGSALPPRAMPPSRPESPTGVKLTDLKTGMCKWPIGDPHDEAFSFCARAVDSPDLETPYCKRHARLAFQPITEKTKTRRDGGKDVARMMRRYV